MDDKNSKVKYPKSIMQYPVVFGIKNIITEKLGFTNKDIKVAYILSAIEKKEFTFAVASSSLSNSGASSFIFFFALMGSILK